MAQIRCRTCNATWNDQDGFGGFASHHFSTASNPRGSFVSVAEIIQSGEALLSCPKDNMEPLDSIIQEEYRGPKSKYRRGEEEQG